MDETWSAISKSVATLVYWNEFAKVEGPMVEVVLWVVVQGCR